MKKTEKTEATGKTARVRRTDKSPSIEKTIELPTSPARRRISVNVAGVSLSLITEESDAFVKRLSESLSKQINAVTSHTFCVSKLDAAILCALDAMGEADKAAAKIKSLEGQIAKMEHEAQNMRDQMETLGNLTAPSKPLDTRTSEEKVRDLEKFLDEKFSSVK